MPLPNFKNGTFVGVKPSKATNAYIRSLDLSTIDGCTYGSVVGKKHLVVPLIITKNEIELEAQGYRSGPFVATGFEWVVRKPPIGDYCLALKLYCPKFAQRRAELIQQGGVDRTDDYYPYLNINRAWNRDNPLPELPTQALVFDKEIVSGALYPVYR